jgi:hypothetical protein
MSDNRVESRAASNSNSTGRNRLSAPAVPRRAKPDRQLPATSSLVPHISDASDSDLWRTMNFAACWPARSAIGVVCAAVPVLRPESQP